jgi:hypothetical protein
VGVPLEGVIESVAEWTAGTTPAGGSNETEPARSFSERTEDEIVAQNNAALAALERMGF